MTDTSIGSSTIRRTRLARGVGVRELARRLGVTPGAVNQMEHSEARGAIQLGTLNRALIAIGGQVGTGPARGTSTGPDYFEHREDRVAWELHVEVAKKLLNDPDGVRGVIAQNVRRMRAHVRGQLVNEWLDRWVELSVAPLGEVIAAMLATDELGREMRKNGPFMGVLSQAERLEAIDRAAARQ
jgi:transcriptional regulator with XRE-family HTH domain